MVLDCERTDQFHNLLNSFLATYQPASPTEMDLVEEMVAARWRIRRMWTVETGLLNGEFRNQQAKIDNPDFNVHLTAAFRTLADESRSLTLNFRYASRLHRIYDGALKNLRELQQNRPRQPDAPAQPTDSEPSPVADSSPTQNYETNPAPNPAPPDPPQPPAEPRASASGFHTQHPRRRAHRGYRFYLAARRRAAGHLSYNEDLLQAASANDKL
jgi:hypothetical protein